MRSSVAFLCLLLCLDVHASGSVGTTVWVASDTDDNAERNISLVGWYDIGDSISVGLSQTVYRFDNQGDEDEGSELISDMSSAYALRLLDVPDAQWEASRSQFQSVYGVDPETASVQQRNAAIARVAAGAHMNDYQETFNRKSVLVKGDIDPKWGYYADIGATSFKGSHLTGNVDLSWRYSESLNYTLSIDRGLADVAYEYSTDNCSVAANMVCDPDAEATIRTTPTLMADYSAGRYGFVVLGGRSHYSDGNDRDFVRSKWYFVASEQHGLSVYFKTRNFSNSQDRLSVAEVADHLVDDQLAMRSNKYLLGSYYSPNDYGQYSVGLGLRKRVARGQILSGYVEQGRQDADNEWSTALSWRVQYDIDFAENYVAQFFVGQDSSASDYKYDYLQLQLLYKFL